MSKINLEQLRKEIKTMNRQNALYRLLKEELSLLGHWKLKARGDPKKAYRVSRGQDV